MRRHLVLVIFATVVAAVSQCSLEGSAFAAPDALTHFVVRNMVTGTDTGTGSAVSLTCDGTHPGLGDTAVFNFDAAGDPTLATGTDRGLTSIVDGAWHVSVLVSSSDESTCQFSEITTGGATSTTWTCTYSITVPPEPAPRPAGCEAASGTGTGPVAVTYAGRGPSFQQTSEVTFMNAFPTSTEPLPVAPVVVAAPAFTA